MRTTLRLTRKLKKSSAHQTAQVFGQQGKLQEGKEVFTTVKEAQA